MRQVLIWLLCAGSCLPAGPALADCGLGVCAINMDWGAQGGPMASGTRF